MTIYVLSTMTNSVKYAFYDTTKLDNPVMRKEIFVRGGASIPSNRSGFGEQTQNSEGVPIWTAAGFVTPINDADFELLKDHPVFKSHLEKNLVKVVNNDITGNHAAIVKHASGMESDGFRQLNASTLKQKIKVSESTLSKEQEYRL